MKHRKRSSFFRICQLLIVTLMVVLAGMHSSEAALPKAPTHGVVVDQVQLLSSDALRKIDAIDKTLQQGSGAEIGVLIIPTLEGQDISSYANEVHRAWGVGQKGKDNGLLIVMATEDKRIYVSVGYGLEGVLNDAKVGQLIDKAAIPRFKEGRYEEGILHLYVALANLVASGEGAPQEVSQELTWQDMLLFAGIIVFIIIDILFWGGRVTTTALHVLSRSRGGGGGYGGGGGRGGFGGGSSGGGGAGRGW